jgi:hypothetical protein
MNRIFALISVLLSLQIQAQFAALNLSAPDSCAFKLYLDDQPANHLFCNAITLQGLEARKTLIKVEFSDSRWTSTTQSIVLKPNMRQDYFVQIVKGLPKVIFSGENVNRSISNAVPTELSNSVPVIAIVPEYAGELGCSSPLSDEDFDNWMGDVDESVFQSQKTEQLTKRSDITCIRVEQLVDCLKRLDSEENKLTVLKYWSGSIFDSDNKSQLTRQFILAANQEKARQLLGIK